MRAATRRRIGTRFERFLNRPRNWRIGRQDAGVATLMLCLWLSGGVLVAGIAGGMVGHAADLDAQAQTAVDVAVVGAVATGGTPVRQAATVRSLASRNGAVIPEGAVTVSDDSVTAAVYLEPAPWGCWGPSGACDPEAALRACAAASTPDPTTVPASCRSLPSAVARAASVTESDGTRTARLVPLGSASHPE